MPAFVDLFAGAGGLSIGLEQAGWEAVAAVEQDADAAATYRSLHSGAKVHEGDIADVDLTDHAGVDLVAGGPPCQPFSTGGKRLAQGDPRDGFPQFVRAVAAVRPCAFLMENVEGVLTPSKRAYYRATLDQLARLGFEISVSRVLAADHGVPQRRGRVIAVGLRHGARFAFPARTHGPDRRHPWPVAGRVIDPERPLGPPNRAKVTYARNPDLRPSPYDGHLFNGGGRPIDLERPAPTLLASMGGNKTPWVDVAGVVPAYHEALLRGDPPRSGEVEGARRLTVAEAAALQSFPRTVRFHGRPSSQYRQVGNAVPPRLARVLGRALARHLDGTAGRDRPQSEIVSPSTTS